MPRGRERIYTEMVRLRLTKEQRQWLEAKSDQQSEKNKAEVKPPMIIRALINQQMDKESELEKVWDG